MSLKKNTDYFVWMDCEMTGLDPEKESILEIATLITDSNLSLVEQGPHLVIHQPQSLLRKMDAWNTKHHTQSGLVEESKKSKITVKQAEKLTLEFLKKYCTAKKSPLCGSGIHHDRRFLIKHMPKVDEYLDYRLIDVSTIKALVRRWYPKIEGGPGKANAHRALPDVLEAIEELRYLRQTFFK
jgi:oligoribonuclease